MTAHEIHALSGAYSVDALDDLERARFEAHLAACAECQAEVASLLDTATLFSTTTAVAPPSEMRDKVLADIKKVRPLPPVVAKLEGRRPRRWASAFVAAAATLGIAGGGITVWQQTHESSQAPRTAPEQIMSAADVTRTTEDLGNGTTVTLYRSESLGKAALKASHMQAAPSGKVYQLWLQNRAGQMISAGLMADPSKPVVLRGDASDSTAVGITVENAGGAETPTIPTIAVIPFRSA